MPDAWEKLLPPNDPKREFILQGVKDGFHICDSVDINKIVFRDNYASATKPHLRPFVEKQILTELEENRYIITSHPATITSAIGAIPKKNSHNVRLIHDCSKPVGYALNDYATNNLFRYQNIQDAVKFISPGSYFAKLDLANAYRSVKTHPSNRHATGLHWTFNGDYYPTFMVDTRLPFGARRSPEVFNELTQAVCCIMRQFGFPSVIAYLDDFLIIGETKSHCQTIMLFLIKLLRFLGFAINYNKVHGPCQRIVFLGILLDANHLTLGLPQDRIEDLKHCLYQVQKCKKITKRELMSLAGKLNWACQVIYGGRFHLRRILDRIHSLHLPSHF